MAGLAERFGVFGSTDGAEKLVGLFTDPWRFGRRSPNGSIDTDHPSLSTVLEAVDGIRLRDLVRSVRVIEIVPLLGLARWQVEGHSLTNSLKCAPLESLSLLMLTAAVPRSMAPRLRWRTPASGHCV